MARQFVSRLRISQMKPERWTGPDASDKIISAIQTMHDDKQLAGIRYLISETVHGSTISDDSSQPSTQQQQSQPSSTDRMTANAVNISANSSSVVPISHLDVNMVLKELNQLRELEMSYRYVDVL